MKFKIFAVAAVVAVALTSTAQTGPKSPLYLTFASQFNTQDIVVVQGNGVINSFPEVYAAPYELPIAVYGDVRTTGDINVRGHAVYAVGGQYTLGGTPTGTFYYLPRGEYTHDSTSDGTYNYLVDFGKGSVYQSARDFTNPTVLFNAGATQLGITYDAANHSLWISGWFDNKVTDYSLGGTVLSSFNTGHDRNAALALDPADQTLWLVNDNTGNLEQYSQTGVLLSVGPNVSWSYGGEFNLGPAATPEPGTLIMFGSGILGLAGVLRRKIKL